MFVMVQAALDPIGNISLALQIVILFLLILGLPFFRGAINRKNLVWHGYSTVAALVLHSILIFLVMIPSLSNGIGELAEISILNLFTIISHAILGTLAEILGLTIVLLWVISGINSMACGKRKRWMMPLFIIWVISIVNGILIHVLGML